MGECDVQVLLLNFHLLSTFIRSVAESFDLKLDAYFFIIFSLRALHFSGGVLIL